MNNSIINIPRVVLVLLKLNLTTVSFFRKLKWRIKFSGKNQTKVKCSYPTLCLGSRKGICSETLIEINVWQTKYRLTS